MSETDKMQKIIDNLNYVPAVAVQVYKELEAAGITDEKRLKIILPVLKQSLQTSRIGDSSSKEFSMTLVSSRNGKPLVKDNAEGESVPFTLKDFIEDFVFEPDGQFSQASGSVSYEESRIPTEEQMQDIASGKKVALPPRHGRSDPKAIPSSAIRQMGQNVDEIASGKTKVDMRK